MEINNCPKCDSVNIEILTTIEFFDIVYIKIKCEDCFHELSGINRQKIIKEWNKIRYKCPDCNMTLNESMFCVKCCSKWTKTNQEESNESYIEWSCSLNNGGDTDYYLIPDGSIYCQDIIESRNMNFSQGNILKAAFCFGIKRGDSDYERDLNKIIWFANRELNRIR